MNKNQKITTILGISLGTRYVGIAVLQNKVLIDWKVKAFLSKWSEKKYAHIITSLEQHLTNYELTAVALKLPHPSRSSKNLNRLIDALKRIAKKKDVEIFEYSLVDLKEYYSENGDLDKQELMACVAKSKPELQSVYYLQKRNKQGYYNKVFEATALSVMGDRAIDVNLK